MNVATFPVGNNLLHSKLRNASVSKNSTSTSRIGLSSSIVGSRSGLEFLDTNALIRTLIADLLADGLSQVTLSHHMGVSPSWFSRWLNEKDGRVLSVSALDGLLMYLHLHQRLVTASIDKLEHALLEARPGNGNGNSKRGT